MRCRQVFLQLVDPNTLKDAHYIKASVIVCQNSDLGEQFQVQFARYGIESTVNNLHKNNKGPNVPTVYFDLQRPFGDKGETLSILQTEFF